MHSPAYQMRCEIIDRALGFAALRADRVPLRATTIALLDTAVDTSHPAFAGVVITAHGAGAYSAHATAMASLILGAESDRHSVALHTFQTRLTEGGSAAAQAVQIQADLATACTLQADLIVLGFEFIGDAPAFVAAIESALALPLAAGIPVFVPAGNHGLIASHPLLRHPAIVPICMVDAEDRLDHRSAWGPLTAHRGLRAVGDAVPVAWPPADYRLVSGTSFAAAVAARAFSAVFGRHRSIASHSVTEALRRAHPHQCDSLNATRTVPPGFDVWAAYQSLSSSRS